MTPKLSRGATPVQLVNLSVEDTDRASRTTSRQGRQAPYFMPICDLVWISCAAQLPGKAMHMACALVHLKRLRKGADVRVSPSVLEAFGLTRQAGYRCLKALVGAGLVEVVDAHVGRAATVRLVGDRAGVAKAELSTGSDADGGK